MHVPIEQFLISIRDGTVIAEEIHTFAHTNALLYKDDSIGWSKNFGFLYYESINYTCRIVFNISEKFIFPVLFSSIKGSCRYFTVCTDENCPSLKQKVIRSIFYKRLAEFCLYLVHASCKNVNANFIFDIFKNY